MHFMRDPFRRSAARRDRRGSGPGMQDACEGDNPGVPMSLFHEGPISMPRAVAPATFELPRGARPFQSVPLRMLADRAVLELMLENGVVDRLLPVATLPGIADAIVAFPGGTVAGTR